MDHRERDKHHTAERYLLGLLPPDERAAFEEHFVGCAECIVALEHAEALQDGILAVAADEAARVRHPKKSLRQRIGEWSLRHTKWEQTWILVLACALFAAGPFLFFHSRLRDANGRLAAIQSESQTWERRYLSERENADRLKRQVDQVRAGQNMVTQLAAAKPAAPPAGVPVLALESGVTAQAEVAASTEWLLLAVQLDEPFPKAVTAKLFGGGGKLLASVVGLKPNARGEVAVSAMTSLFETGYYTLSVGGVNHTFHLRLRTKD